MSDMKIFDIAGSGLQAQSMRMNLIASNMANADTVSGTPEGAYRARQPVFQAVLQAVVVGIAPGQRQDREGRRRHAEPSGLRGESDSRNRPAARRSDRDP